MKWKLTLAQKIRTGLALMVVFLLVIATNLIDKNHFKIVQGSLYTMYEDRLVGKGYLYKIARQLQYKRKSAEVLSKDEWPISNAAVNDSILVLMNKFGETKLTEEEKLRLKSLQTNLNTLFEQENLSDVEISVSQDLPPGDRLAEVYDRAMHDLDALMDIQLAEGKREKIISTRVIDTSNLIAQIEIGILVLIGFLIQLLIFVKPLK